MKTRLLLDTCAAIWIVEESPMDPVAVDTIATAIYEGRPLLASPITAWERGMLASKGRLTSPLDPKVWFSRLMSQDGIELAPLSPDILTDASFLPGSIHSDPADRIIIATARAHDLTIVTRDRAILSYAEAGHVRALVC